MKTIDDQSDVATIHFLNNLIGQFQRLHTAILLAQELKCQRDVVGYSGQVSYGERPVVRFNVFQVAPVCFQPLKVNLLLLCKAK